MAKHQIVSRCSQAVTSNTTCAFVVHWVAEERCSSKSRRVSDAQSRNSCISSACARQSGTISDSWKEAANLQGVWSHLEEIVIPSGLASSCSWTPASMQELQRSSHKSGDSVWKTRQTLTYELCPGWASVCSTAAAQQEEVQPEVHAGSSFCRSINLNALKRLYAPL